MILVQTVPRKRCTKFTLCAAMVTSLAALVAPGEFAKADTPAAICAQVGTDDPPRPIPESLVPSVNRTFGTALPPELALAGTVYRCASGHTMICTTGANLTCGRADVTRVPTPGMTEWCRDHENAAFIPASVTGHATIFAWQCLGTTPRIARRTRQVDPRGFIADEWKQAP